MSAITDKWLKAVPLYTDTLAGAISNATVTTFQVTNGSTDLENGEVYEVTIDRVDASGVSTGRREVAIAQYTSATKTFDCSTADYRGIEGTAQGHPIGAVVEILATSHFFNQRRASFLAEHNQDGTHKTGLALTSPVLTTPKVVTSINDANGNEVIKTPATASAVNEVTVTNSATGNAVQVSATGDDTNIDLKLVPKGTGGILDKNGDYIGPNSSMARQAIINGNFDVWQRGTSNSIADVTVTYTADRWYDYADKNGGTLPTLTRSRQAQTAGDLQSSFYFTRLATNGAGTSLGVNSYHQYAQKIEHGTRMLAGNGKKVTVSFYARSSIANKKIGVLLVQNYGTGGSPTSEEIITNGDSITLTSSWVKHTRTFTTNTLASKTFGTDNNDSLRLIYVNMWGDTIGDAFGLTGAETYVGSGNIDIAQIQLCAGDVALPFQPKSYEEELRACQRYCFVPDLTAGVTVVGIGTGSSTTIARILVNLPVTMRTINPTLTATAGDYQLYDGSNAASDLTVIGKDDAVAIGKNLYAIKATVASGLTQYRPYMLISDGTANRVMIIDAEL